MELELDEPQYLGTATYCPEDNKLRFYAFARLDAEDYQKVKKAGFRWAPKQELFVKPRWTPAAEDLLLELCGGIDDEDQNPEDRAADRADRFAMYRDKREGEALGHADNYDSGDAVHGFQSEKKARASVNRQERQRVKAFSQWDKAEYWQVRTKAVIVNALYKSTPQVRRSRILRIEADQRKKEKEILRALASYMAWNEVREQEDLESAQQKAEFLAGDLIGLNFVHPRTGKENWLHYLMRDENDPLTPYEAADLYFSKIKRPDPEKNRILNHYKLRLAYERQMIEAEGGSADELEMLEGGFIGRHQILKVNRSPITKKIVSVTVRGTAQELRGWGGAQEITQTLNIQRASKEAYRAPTPEELEAFKSMQTAEKQQKKEANAGAPKLINPTKEEAQRLQDIWNEGKKEIQTITEMTQAEYKKYSSGSYGSCETVRICEDGTQKSTHWNAKDGHKKIVCKVRRGYKSANFSNAAYSVIVITDKPQKTLPEFKKVVTVEPANKVTT